MCREPGSRDIFNWILKLMETSGRKEKMKSDIKKLAVNIIYTLCYDLSQKCNFMQKHFGSFLLSENLNRSALDTAKETWGNMFRYNR